MTNAQQIVQDDLVVELAYVLRLDDGEVVDEATPDEPLEYLHGHANIISGLEVALTGLKVGDRRHVVVSPADGYGDYDPDDVESIPLSEFPSDIELEEGLALQVYGDDGGVYTAIVESIADGEVLLDFNHPLAGENLHFDVEVVGLRSATPEELAHGHAHSDFDDDDDDEYDDDDL